MGALKPLCDEWLYWDPAQIQTYPDGAPAPADPRARRPVPAPEAAGRRLGREMLRYAAAGFAAGLASALVLGALVMLLPGSAAAAEAPAGGLVRLSDVARGSLLFATGTEGLFQPAPVQETDVRIAVAGPVARATVRQRFRNPGRGWVEGVYVFPLPEGAAVDRLRMRIGERVIEGRIQEREAARQTYEAAKQAGRKASLVSQERPNVFTNAVANIGPGETVEVSIEYQETLRYEHGAFALRFPLVVGLRYVPGTARPVSEAAAGDAGTGWAPDTDRVPDASRVTPPVVAPGGAQLNPVTLAVELDAGLPLAEVRSLHHAVHVHEAGETRRTVTLDGPVPADRDFVLRWRAREADAPRAALFAERGPDATYLLMMVMPPAAGFAAPVPRDVIYVIDTSGSMGGDSIGQARRALLYGLERLRPGDRFNVIRFNSTFERLFAVPEPVTARSLDRARRYVSALEAGGGTEMLPALHAALAGAAQPGRVRQILFVTDGAVANEAELFAAIEARLGEARLFTVGIGSAPNSHFMRRAARFGRGSFTYIGKPEEVQERMQALFTKLESPVMGGLRLDWPEVAGEVEAWPQRLPDLYAGEPLVLAARVARPGGALRVAGRRGGASWDAIVPLAGWRDHPGISVLWARRKIEALMDAATAGTEAQAVRAAVTALGLRHHLVTRYTSLVAVDVTPARDPADPLAARAVPTNLPRGWDQAKVFGSLPRTATPAAVHLLAGMACLLLAGLAYRRSGRGP